VAKKLHIDIETFSSVDIKKSGAYKYVDSMDFEILMVSYAIGQDPVQIIDLALGEELPADFIAALLDPTIEKHAHNANFERICFRQYGYDIPIKQWRCTAVKAAYCGLPISLDAVSKVLLKEDKQKLATGKALISFFCCPIKPTKTNDMRARNFPRHDFEKWEEFKKYCIRDTEAERDIDNILSKYKMPQFEIDNYILDQEINDRGIEICREVAENAIYINDLYSEELKERAREITGLQNPNSVPQLKKWLSEQLQKEVTSLAKENVADLIKEVEVVADKEMLKIRSKLSKTSIKKYQAMIDCLCYDGRAHGLFQFYGANRTGRWAGRLIPLQNLVRNKIKDLETVREMLLDNAYDLLKMIYDDLSYVLSQLVRTAFIPKEGCIFAVADFSAIEARVTAWLADETWRLDVIGSSDKINAA